MTSQIITTYLQHLTWLGRSPDTLDAYGGTLRRLVLWLEHGDLLQATADELTQWRAQLHVADASIVAYGSTIKSFYRWAVQAGHLHADPAAYLPLPRLSRRLPRPIAEDLLEDAIDRAPAQIRPWLVLAGYCGLRCCEIARLRREDIQEIGPSPHIRVLGKGGTERIVPLTPYVWQEIRAGLPRRGWLHVRADGKGGPVTRKVVSKYSNVYLRSCGIPDTMHSLRHRYGTVAYAAERDLRAVQELLGHASPSTTAGYAAYSNPAAIRAAHATQPKRRLRPLQKPEES